MVSLTVPDLPWASAGGNLIVDADPNSDPLGFVDPSARNYALLEGSPAIDQGVALPTAWQSVPAAWHAFVEYAPTAGSLPGTGSVARGTNGPIDVGAYEYLGTSTATPTPSPSPAPTPSPTPTVAPAASLLPATGAPTVATTATPTPTTGPSTNPGADTGGQLAEKRNPTALFGGVIVLVVLAGTGLLGFALRRRRTN